MADLRPIGAEFEFDFPPSAYSTETMVTRIRFRVVEHVKASRGPRERIEPVWIKKLYPVSYTIHGAREASIEVHEVSETPPDFVTIKI